MSTRSTAHFIDYSDTKPTAIIYRHSDGYPDGAGVDLRKFLAECATLPDPRFTDPAYLAAKYVVWLANEFNWTYDFSAKGMVKQRPTSRLEFLSVGIMDQDPGDIEYRYIVNCSKMVDGLPELKCFNTYSGAEEEIPDIPVATD